MNVINELKKKQDEAYRKRFERWYKKFQIEKEIEITAVKVRGDCHRK